MDKEIRNRIQRATQDARSLLEREYAEQLEGTFDIRLDGMIAAQAGSHLDAAQRIQRAKLVAAVEHFRAGGLESSEAVASYLREAAFTTLNRFVALKMLEARGLLQECISHGEQSSGFKEFTGLALGLVQLPDHGYQLYIESLFDEIGREVGILFDRYDPASLLWPRRQALLDLIGTLNSPELAGVWGQDETIGWVYQYFNRDEERKDMRAASQAPRNSRELAVRNQFFTPRYVVQFLTENTLGRIWYEMRQGKTLLVDTCEYFVRHTREIFLPDGEAPPDDSSSPTPITEGLTELDYVSFRPKKDPRDIKLLDPACGSAHFLIYGFDLFLTIYQEAWADDRSPASQITGRSLREDYPTIETLRREIPQLILRHNLYGIDIDPRAAQIAALALWMRAQRAFNEFGVSRAERSAVSRTNVVVAEPMPGESELRREFVASVEKPLGKIIDRVFTTMDLAGEAGSLLKIEDEIQAAIRNVHERTGELFRKSDEERWNEAEKELLRALRTYSERAQNGGGYRRRLFADDAARGFGFIDVCRARFDAVVMNPPFGDAAVASLALIDELMAASGRDVGAAFVRDAISRWTLDGGKVGALLSTAPWFKPAFEQWRLDLFCGRLASIDACAHFGGEVLDGATVNASPLILGKRPPHPAIIFRLTRHPDLAAALQRSIAALIAGRLPHEILLRRPSEACVLPGKPFSYWMSIELLSRIRSLKAFEGTGGTVKQGTATADEFRFSRAWWEVPVNEPRWIPYTKSSPYSPFWDDITWAGWFGDDMRQIVATGRARVQGIEYFGSPGVTYPSKAVLGFNARLQPKGAGFGHSGSVVFPIDGNALALLGFLASRPVEYLLSLFIGELQGKAGVHPNHYEVGTIQRLPWPSFSHAAIRELESAAVSAVQAMVRLATLDETTRDFCCPLLNCTDSFDANYQAALTLEQEALRELCRSRNTVDHIVADAYGFTSSDLDELNQAFDNRVPPASGKWRLYFGEEGSDIDLEEYGKMVLSWLFGLALERWRSGQLDPVANRDVLAEPMRQPPSAGSHGVAILVDDPGHPCDTTARIIDVTVRVGWNVEESMRLSRAVVAAGCTSGAIREYVSTQFFEDHKKRYSKSRVKAPVYWQLATPSALYSVWLYFHTINKDSIYKVITDYVAPKLRHEERKLADLLQRAGASPASSKRREVDAQQLFVAEIRCLHEELLRVAPLWNPDLNDGVMLNFAPLWRLVPQHRAWQNECRQVWNQLVNAEYDWSHLAMHLWPERVVPKCATDRSLAIAHGLEDVFWMEGADGKWQPRKVDRATIDQLIAERTSSAAKAALKSLLEAPAPGNGGAKRSRSGGTVRRVRRTGGRVVGEQHA